MIVERKGLPYIEIGMGGVFVDGRPARLFNKVGRNRQGRTTDRLVGNRLIYRHKNLLIKLDQTFPKVLDLWKSDAGIGAKAVKESDNDMTHRFFHQSTVELRVWNLVKPKDREYFQAPIYGVQAEDITDPYSIGFIITRIAPKMKGRPSAKILARAMEKALEIQQRYLLMDLGTRYGYNWWVRPNGKLVIVDWGY